jgi:tetratricopeptide (TPR) repeat protein
MPQDRLADQLRKGIVQEETGQNLDKAIEAYRAIVAQFDDERKTAATALFRLAECSRKAGKREQAVAAYQRVVREFGDQASLVEPSRRQLTALGVSEPREVRSDRAPSAAERAQLEQEVRNLREETARRTQELRDREAAMAKLEQALRSRELQASGSGEVAREIHPERDAASLEELKLDMKMMQGRMEEMRSKVETGLMAPLDLKTMETQYAILVQRYREQEEARGVQIELTQQMIKSVESEIALVQEQITALQKKVSAGLVAAQDERLLQLRRDLIGLQRRLDELRAGLKR